MHTVVFYAAIPTSFLLYPIATHVRHCCVIVQNLGLFNSKASNPRKVGYLIHRWSIIHVIAQYLLLYSEPSQSFVTLTDIVFIVLEKSISSDVVAMAFPPTMLC